MIASNTIKKMTVYGGEATYKEQPTTSAYTKGVVPLDTLPAQWWNWLWNTITTAEASTYDMIDSIYKELVSVLTAAGYTVDASQNVQVKNAIQKLIDDKVGSLSDLKTTAKTTLQAAVNELVTNIGALSGLTTTSKDTVVAAINSIKSELTSEMTDRKAEDAKLIPLAQKGVADGVATLDSTGRIPYAQLPESAMEYKGMWDATTNTPTLIDGTGDTGDFYLVSKASDAGTSVTFGTGNTQEFQVNDRVIYDGSKWQRLRAGILITVDDKLDLSSKNPVQNRVVSDRLNDLRGCLRITSYSATGIFDMPTVSMLVDDGYGNPVPSTFASAQEVPAVLIQGPRHSEYLIHTANKEVLLYGVPAGQPLITVDTHTLPGYIILVFRGSSTDRARLYILDLSCMGTVFERIYDGMLAGVSMDTVPVGDLPQQMLVWVLIFTTGEFITGTFNTYDSVSNTSGPWTCPVIRSALDDGASIESIRTSVVPNSDATYNVHVNVEVYKTDRYGYTNNTLLTLNAGGTLIASFPEDFPRITYQSLSAARVISPATFNSKAKHKPFGSDTVFVRTMQIPPARGNGHGYGYGTDGSDMPAGHWVRDDQDTSSGMSYLNSTRRFKHVESVLYIFDAQETETEEGYLPLLFQYRLPLPRAIYFDRYIVGENYWVDAETGNMGARSDRGGMTVIPDRKNNRLIVAYTEGNRLLFSIVEDGQITQIIPIPPPGAAALEMSVETTGQGHVYGPYAVFVCAEGVAVLDTRDMSFDIPTGLFGEEGDIQSVFMKNEGIIVYGGQDVFWIKYDQGEEPYLWTKYVQGVGPYL